jgi:GTP-binding protein
MQKYHPPMIDGRRLRVFYLAQVDIQPPRFVFFVNRPELMAESYKKYLINQFREAYGFLGAPVQFFLKGRTAREEKREGAAAPIGPDEDEEFVFEEPSEAELQTLDASYF